MITRATETMSPANASATRITLIVGPAARVEAGVLAFALGGAHVMFDVGVAVDAEAAATAIARATRGGVVRDVVIDGFPRTVEEAQHFDAAVGRSGLVVARVVSASIASDGDLVRERALRRVCASSACGARYHLEQLRPRVVDTCDACGAVGLVRAPEDADAAVIAEAAEQHRVAAALCAHYAPQTVERTTAEREASERSDDPETLLTQMLLALQSQLVEAKQHVAIAIADEKRLLKQADVDRALSAQWEEKAALAVKAGSEELARQALARGHEHAALALGYDAQWQQQKACVDELKEALQSLNSKIEEAKRRKNLLVARLKRAEAQRTVAETLARLDASGVMPALDRLARAQEAEAQAVFTSAQERDEPRE
jgi:phage shock protein A